MHTDIALGNERLLKLADILDVADAEHRKAKEPTYSQRRIVHDCGTPACAAGHWAYANKDRWEIRNYCTYLRASPLLGPNVALGVEFSLDRAEVHELFGSCGCGDAETAQQAARYIRAFVARRTRS